MSKLSVLYAYHQKTFFLLLTLCVGLALLYPVLDYQPFLAQGDHGRDLYAFKKALDGKIPYRDYWWVYGPLMPYYYSLFYIFFGVNIQSVLIGKAALYLSSCLFFYLTLSTIATPLWASLGTIWFLTFYPDFFFTYNHAGGITMILAIISFICFYIKQQKIKYLYLSLTCILILNFIKINFGFVALLGFLISFFLIDFMNKNPITLPKNIIYFLAIFVLPLITFSIYFLLLKELPIYAIRQCLPYLSADHPYHTSIWISIPILFNAIIRTLTFDWLNFLLGLLFIFSFVQTIFSLINKKIDKNFKTQILLILGLLTFFYLANLHEFLVSGVYYRYFWAKPFSILLIFMFIFIGTKNLPRIFRLLLYIVLSLILFFPINNNIYILKQIKIPSQYLSLERGKIFLGNNHAWIDTIQKTTYFLEDNLKADELFFALPYDPLYYFLTNKESPTRQLIFFDHINIPKEQEIKIISELAEKKVDWILLSSRSKSAEPALGSFGETYCPLLADYINRYFKVVAEFGDWQNPPGWAWNHGVRILKRIDSLVK